MPVNPVPAPSSRIRTGKRGTNAIGGGVEAVEVETFEEPVGVEGEAEPSDLGLKELTAGMGGPEDCGELRCELLGVVGRASTGKCFTII